MATYIKSQCGGGCGSNPCCNGMFKELGVDIELPIATGTITEQWSRDPTWDQHQAIGVLSYSEPPVVGVIGNLSLQWFPSQFTPSFIPSDVLYLRIYNPCAGARAAGPVKGITVNMSLPTAIRVSDDAAAVSAGWCEYSYIDPETEQFARGPDVYFSGYVPRPQPCDEGGAFWWEWNPDGPFLTYESFQDYTFPIVTFWTGEVYNEKLQVSFESQGDIFLTNYPDNISYAVNGVVLKNLDTNQTYSATESDFGMNLGGVYDPFVGTGMQITFSGFNRTTPGNYELVWPLLKQPFRFTIPAP